ncbi:high mobility group-T protein-like protein [Dinothrombium tinctorium]|uniref:High mobility group-T protein-like protein n=1 Tax=Dinothrombium tinctorium TaxID=1965070 RepID=A0A3S3RZK7_9ACAR|nr:high mobility group-T protein-like protein [Dinothrombium tinctorium]
MFSNILRNTRSLFSVRPSIELPTNSVRPLATRAKKAAKNETSGTKKRETTESSPSVASIISLYDLPLKPKRPMSAYNVFCKEIFNGRRANNEITDLSSTMKEASERWKTLSAAEKAKYERQVENDRKRYEKELQEYKKVMDQKITVKDFVQTLNDYLKEAEVERNSLKKMSAFHLFLREEVKDKGIKLAEAARHWNSLDERTKSEYKERAEKMNEEYKRKVQNWNEKFKLLSK